MNNMLTSELILHEHNYTLPVAGERRSQEEDRHGASDSACCPADSLTSAAVVSSYVKEDEELLSHLETLEDIKEELCCPAEASGPNGDANHLTRYRTSRKSFPSPFCSFCKF